MNWSPTVCAVIGLRNQEKMRKMGMKFERTLLYYTFIGGGQVAKQQMTTTYHRVLLRNGIEKDFHYENRIVLEKLHYL